MTENWLECRDCGDEFNADDPETREIGYYNQCLDCAEEAGDVEKVMGFINTNEDGDFDSVSVMQKKDFEKAMQVLQETGSIRGSRG